MPVGAEGNKEVHVYAKIRQEYGDSAAVLERWKRKKERRRLKLKDQDFEKANYIPRHDTERGYH